MNEEENFDKEEGSGGGLLFGLGALFGAAVVGGGVALVQKIRKGRKQLEIEESTVIVEAVEEPQEAPVSKKAK